MTLEILYSFYLPRHNLLSGRLPYILIKTAGYGNIIRQIRFDDRQIRQKNVKLLVQICLSHICLINKNLIIAYEILNEAILFE